MDAAPPTKIKLAGGDEHDVFSGWRALLCYTRRPGVCKWVKRKYNRRLRRVARLELRCAA